MLAVKLGTCVLLFCFVIISSSVSSVHSCDQTSNCFDESDEDNCKLLFLKVFTKDNNFPFYFHFPRTITTRK